MEDQAGKKPKKEKKDKPPVDLNTRLAVDVDEAAAIICIGRSHLYAEIRRGRLRALKSATKTLIATDELRRYIASLPTIGAAS